MKTAEEYKGISIKYWIDFDSGSIDTGEYENRIESLFKQAQKDAYNQALDDCLKHVAVYQDEWFDHRAGEWRLGIPTIDKESILKLKK